MTLNKYNKKMDEYSNRLSELYGDEWEELYGEMSVFQQEYMGDVLEEYEKKIDCEAREFIYDLLDYAVRNSESGSSVVHVETKETADEIEDIIWDEIGDYLLDCEIYEDDGLWVIDCMFAGYYIPYWDGWCEE